MRSGKARRTWLVFFLSVTGIALGAELWASFDGNPNTDPWTDLLVKHVPAEVTFALVGALMLWLPLHFGRRYWDRRKQK